MFTTQYQPTHLKSVRGHYLIRLNYIYEHKRQVKGSVPTTREHITREADCPSPQLTDSRVQRSEQPPRPTRAEPVRSGPAGARRARCGAAPPGRRQRAGDGARPFPGQPHRPPHPRPPPAAPRRRKSGRGSTAARRGRGGSAGLGRRSSAVSTETPARAELATQRGPAGVRKILGGRGRNGAGPGGRGDPGNLYSQPTARLSRTPRRRLPVHSLTATARRGGAGSGLVFPPGAARRAQEGGRPHTCGARRAPGEEHVPGAGGPGHACRAGAPGAGGGRAAPAATTLHAAERAGGSGGAARLHPPGGSTPGTGCPPPSLPAVIMSLPPGAVGRGDPSPPRPRPPFSEERRAGVGGAAPRLRKGRELGGGRGAGEGAKHSARPLSVPVLIGAECSSSLSGRGVMRTCDCLTLQVEIGQPQGTPRPEC